MGFDALEKEERKQLFAAIVDAVPPEPPALPAVSVPAALPAAVAPEGLQVELTATQREGLAWLLKSEEETHGLAFESLWSQGTRVASLQPLGLELQKMYAYIHIHTYIHTYVRT